MQFARSRWVQRMCQGCLRRQGLGGRLKKNLLLTNSSQFNGEE